MRVSLCSDLVAAAAVVFVRGLGPETGSCRRWCQVRRRSSRNWRAILRPLMNRVAALLAAALAGAALAACGGGAEPGAPKGATLVLDFQPNAVHSGIYAALAE